MKYGQTEKRTSQTMRIFKGLENIHSVIDRHETEWRRENGEPELRTPDKIAESVRQRLAVQPDSKNGRFDESRFLGGSRKPAKKPEPAEEITHEIESESAKFSADRFLGGNTEPEITNEPEAVEIIKDKNGRHSWLYNEVMKAINDASKGTSAKIIAVFVPVVQGAKEFEDLPADEIITVSPVDESLAKIDSTDNAEPSGNETPSEDFNLIPEIQPEQKAEIAETFREMEEMLEEKLEPEIITDEVVTEEVTPAVTAEESVPEAVIEESVTEEVTPAVTAEESEPEIITEEAVTEELTPAIVAEEAEPAVITEESVTEEVTPAVTAEESEPDIFTAELMPAITQPESESESEIDDIDDVLQDGEPMEFTEIENMNGEELKLNDELDDDNIFDESLTEIHRPDDDKALIIDEDGIVLPDDEEIEIIPDPKK